MQHALIIQGGGFRTAFSAGVLDAFLEKNYRPFDLIVAVSGGAIAASYFISGQPKHCFDSICFLAEKGRFVKYSNFFRNLPIMNIDIFHDISNKHYPFNDKSAHDFMQGKKFFIVMTNKKTGLPHYCDPIQTNWREAVIASCSLPFITKGKHELNGEIYMDGAWGDPLPVEWVATQGVNKITIVRTSPPEEKISKSWIDFIGEMYYRKNENLRKSFTDNHELYNRSIDFIQSPPQGLLIQQIAPNENLKSGLYTNSKEDLSLDYQNGKKQSFLFLEKVTSKV